MWSPPAGGVSPEGEIVGKRVVGWKRALACAGVAAMAVVGTAHGATAEQPETAPPHALQARGHSADARTQAGKNGGTNGISYHGGPLILGTTNAYVIWYGNWAGNTATTIIPDFFSAVGGSPYFNINTTYTDGAGRRITNAVRYAGSTTDAYSQGSTNLSDAAIQAIVNTAVTTGALPKDTNGVYFVLTSSDVTKSGFKTNYCGWHTYATIAGSPLQYSFVGDATGASFSSCAVQTTSSPNGNPGADAMVSVIAHELEEAATDPRLNAWYDNRGYENADKCAWTFGTTYSTANGSLANMKLGTRDFLIQRNWVNASGGYCALSY